MPRARRLTYVNPFPTVPCPVRLKARSVIRPIIPCGCRRRPTPTPITVPTPTPFVPAGPPPNSCPCAPIPSTFAPRLSTSVRADAIKVSPTSQTCPGYRVGQTEAQTDKNDGSNHDSYFIQHSLLLAPPLQNRNIVSSRIDLQRSPCHLSPQVKRREIRGAPSLLTPRSR